MCVSIKQAKITGNNESLMLTNAIMLFSQRHKLQYAVCFKKPYKKLLWMKKQNKRKYLILLTRYTTHLIQIKEIGHALSQFEISARKVICREILNLH